MKTKNLLTMFALTTFVIMAVSFTPTVNKISNMTDDSTAYATNGETIFRTGRNKDGKILHDLKNSMMNMMVMGCTNCHGSDGLGGMMMMMRTVPSIRYSDLTDPAKHTVPYNDSLLFRFLDHELKSDGTKAQTGIVWKMGDKDKADLIEFLKTLEGEGKPEDKTMRQMCPMMKGMDNMNGMDKMDMMAIGMGAMMGVMMIAMVVFLIGR